MIVTCSSNQISTTLNYLQEAGRNNLECVVLWLGKRKNNAITVEDVYLPIQHAEADMFHITPVGMTNLQIVLRQHRLMVAAQVHSHPEEAFHSSADDKWAIVRHENALSLVLPNFALNTTNENFLNHTKVFRFSPSSEWTDIPRKDLDKSWLQIS